jgi:hypothetical protein
VKSPAFAGRQKEGAMAGTTISVLNPSTVMKDSEVEALLPALQTQLDRDFLQAWNIPAELVFVPHGTAPDPDSWWLSILDNSDQAGALGYHDVTNEGLPLGKVFAGTDLANGYLVSVTCSHEILEMLADPEINQCVFLQRTARQGLLVGYEVCDAVEADNLGYDIDGVRVSDFMTPRWFMPGFPGPYDQQGHCTKALQVLPGGYISVFDVTKGTGWQQVTADKVLSLLDPGEEIEARTTARAISRPHPGMRRERRRTPRDEWERSTVAF